MQGEIVSLRERLDKQEERLAEFEGFEIVELSLKREVGQEVNWNFRLCVAIEIGTFLAASLAGGRVGRSKIPLRSCVYVLVRGPKAC